MNGDLSRVGESWRDVYRQGELSWCHPDVVSAEYFERYAGSEWITVMLRETGLRPGPGVSVLEAGCGTATFAIALGLRGFSVHAFDYNVEALEIARVLKERVERVGKSLPVELFRGNLLKVSAPSAAYDLVFNQSVLEYFIETEERRRGLDEMVRLARSGGWVAAIVQHGGHPFTSVWKRLGWPGYTGQPSLHCYTSRLLEEEFRNAGLAGVQVNGIYPWKSFFFWPPFYRRWKLTDQLAYLMLQALNRGVPLPKPLRRLLGFQLIAVGRKP